MRAGTTSTHFSAAPVLGPRTRANVSAGCEMRLPVDLSRNLLPCRELREYQFAHLTSSFTGSALARVTQMGNFPRISLCLENHFGKRVGGHEKARYGAG